METEEESSERRVAIEKRNNRTIVATSVVYFAIVIGVVVSHTGFDFGWEPGEKMQAIYFSAWVLMPYCVACFFLGAFRLLAGKRRYARLPLSLSGASFLLHTFVYLSCNFS